MWTCKLYTGAGILVFDMTDRSVNVDMYTHKGLLHACELKRGRFLRVQKVFNGAEGWEW